MADRSTSPGRRGQEPTSTDNNPANTDINKETKAGSGDQQQASSPLTLAHEQADADIASDPEISAHSPNDDLDEGELARLGEDNNPIE